MGVNHSSNPALEMGRPPCFEDGLNKGVWTAHEDEVLGNYVKLHGEGKWVNVAKATGLKRSAKSCRLRWLNYLKPDIKRGNIALDEEDLIIRLHRLLGNRWSLIAKRLPGRTDNEIKNYWHSTLKKKVQESSSNHCKSKKKHVMEPSAESAESLKMDACLSPNKDVIKSSSNHCKSKKKPMMEPSAESAESLKMDSCLSPNKDVINCTTSSSAHPFPLPFLVDEHPEAFTSVEPSFDEGLGKEIVAAQPPESGDEIFPVNISCGNDALWDSLMDFDVDQLCLSEILDENFASFSEFDSMIVGECGINGCQDDPLPSFSDLG
ncbi:hypothetical protein PVL29_004037 [Vitis rotundifolia]|uniref:Uncharacterized protein n=1 Tax=Vitis rotundifolia TaxID=103349 RepID=A0AA39A6Y0_VITRO|nr:hypothetical protein PVL29_004037 [Vitis rotundifolia]